MCNASHVQCSLNHPSLQNTGTHCDVCHSALKLVTYSYTLFLFSFIIIDLEMYVLLVVPLGIAMPAREYLTEWHQRATDGDVIRA